MLWVKIKSDAIKANTIGKTENISYGMDKRQKYLDIPLVFV